MSLAASFITVLGLNAQELPVIDTTNPLLSEWTTPYQTPPFDKIELKDYKPAFEVAIAVARAEIAGITANKAKPTFENTIVPLERSGALIGRIAGVFFNLLSAATSPEMQQISLEVQPMLTAYSNDLFLNEALFERVKKVHKKPGKLTAEQRRLLENTYKGFVRNGANLSDADKETYRQLTLQLSELQLVFGQNSLEATNAYTLNLTDEADVADLPEFVKEGMAAEAKARGQEGWTVTLQSPSYVPFMTYSNNRPIKEKLYRVYGARALGGENDNTEVIRKIVNLRLKLANLLGYKTFADYVLEDRMAGSSEAVNDFLDELLVETKDYAVKDVETIAAYAQANGLEGELMPWDFAYWSEKYKEQKYALNDELLKPYLELDNVVKGVFMLATKLYGLEFTPNKEIAVYHPEVTAWEVRDNGRLMAILYLDFFPRDSKRAGAWMTTFRENKIVDGVETRPLVSLVMNFTKPTATTPSLLTWMEFTTFLHEFGHALHGILAEGQYESQTGTNVYRDFVELPSQIMENWATEKEFLDLWAVHYQTGEKIPAELIEKIKASENYQAAYGNIRQLSFGFADMSYHSITHPLEGDVELFENAAMESTRLFPEVKNVAMSPTFSHIFSGGYAAGYYGYKWSEVMEADAYSLFKERGIFNHEVANAFRREVLSMGDRRHPMESYVKFRGHTPETKALIEKMGLGKE